MAVHMHVVTAIVSVLPRCIGPPMTDAFVRTSSRN